MQVSGFRSRFMFESLPGGFFIRLPFLGEGVWNRDPVFRTWDSWATLKALGQV